jgi:hypothetical protein
LKAKGVDVTRIFNHDDSPTQSSDTVTDSVFVRSVYFFDPDGVCLEFAAWTKVFNNKDIAHDPVDADGQKVANVILRAETMLAENDIKVMEPAE